MNRFLIITVWTTVWITVWLPLSGAVSAESVDYVRDIKPILRQRCFPCHGALKQEAELRLDTAVLMQRGGDSGSAIDPSDAQSSLLIERVSADDEAERMPPEGEPLSPQQIELLKKWIDAGANAPEDERPDEDPRKHWAFQRIVRPAVPVWRRKEGAGSISDARNPIDAFLVARLREHGIEPQPAAPRHVLLRRVYLDLIGVPPTREELQAFLDDPSPAAYETVVDRLLNDPRYGERWARHWMDVWRYSDWYGRRHVPDVWNSAPQIWRWRDWIVDSLNRDHGYDRMLQEMLAADEIAPEDTAAGYATGYLIRNWYALNPNDWMRNTVEHTGKAFLGLTFNCAHCHDHKYDPISQDDYFRLRAFFEPMYLRQDRVAGEPDPGPFEDYNYGKLRKVQRLGAVRIFDRNPAAPTWFYTGGDERNRVKERGSVPPGVPEFLSGRLAEIEPIELPPRAWYPGLRPEIQETVLAAARRALSDAQTALIAARESHTQPSQAVELSSPTLRVAEAHEAAARAELASVEARIAADRARYGETPKANVAELIRAASRAEREAALRKAEANALVQQEALAKAEAESESASAEQRGPVDKRIAAATKALAAVRAQRDGARKRLADTALDETYTAFSPVYPKTSTGRRRALAKWITHRDNPLTARVAVNHIWLRHFHSPLVASVYDFGRNGDRPTHPQLLDWLAAELMESSWSMKHLHRLIVTSAAYRRVSSTTGASHSTKVDPENKLLWRMNTGRMEAEVIRDSLLYCAGRLDLTLGGQELENSESLRTYRRSLYYAVYPEQGGKSPLGELFDGPDALECYRRTQTVIPQQALALTNSELVHEVSAAMVRRLGVERAGRPEGKEKIKEEDAQDGAFVVAVFETVLSRRPTEAELQLCLAALQVEMPTGDAKVRARESVVRVLLNHNDFVTIR